MTRIRAVVKATEALHSSYVYPRRVEVLASHLAEVIPSDALVLDIGCGDGLLAARIGALRPDLEIRGVDVFVREKTHIPVGSFDGRRIPGEDESFDVVMFVDVLHHAKNPELLLREARRATRRAVVIKDHTREGFLAGPTLRLMDWVGNAPHGVALPYNYWSERRWLEAFEAVELNVASWRSDLNIYPWALDLVLGRRLHFLARLEKEARVSSLTSS